MSDLPPLDQPQAYVVVGPNDQRGPYTLDLLIGEVVAGRLHDATPVWWPGLAEWTTMNGQAAVAAEIARRRGVEVQAAPAPVAPAPEAAAAPASPTATDPYSGYSAAPATDPSASYSAPVDAAPMASQLVEPAAAQYGETAYDPAAYGAAEPVQSGSGQGYSYDPAAGVPVSADPQAPLQPGPEPEPQAPAPAAAPVTSTPAGWTVTDTSTPVGALAPESEVLTPEVVTAAEVPAAVEAPRASSVTDEHRSLFADLVDRSTRRAEAGAQIEALDAAVCDAVVSGAESQGFTSTDRSTGETNHELRFEGGPGETLSITVGRIRGSDPAAVRDGHTPLTVRFQSATYAGGLEAGMGAHGEVVIVSDEWSGQATSTVSLLLPLADYVAADLTLDNVALLRDVGATVSVVSDRLR